MCCIPFNPDGARSLTFEPCREDEGIALAASCALTSVFKNVFSHPISLQIADAAGTAQTALDLLQLSKSAHLTAALWDLFAISYSGAPSFELYALPICFRSRLR